VNKNGALCTLPDKDIDDTLKAVHNPMKQCAKSVAALKSALTKRYASLAQGAKEAKNSSSHAPAQTTALSTVLAVAFGALADRVNVVDTADRFAAFTPVAFGLGDELKTTLGNISAAKRFFEWMDLQLRDLKDAQVFCGSVPAVGFNVPIRRLVKSRAGDSTNLFVEKAVGIGAPKQFIETLQALYEFQCVKCKPCYSTMHPLPYAAAELRIIIDGEQNIAGIRIPLGEQAESYNVFVTNVAAMDGASLATLVAHKDNFSVKAKCGDVLCLPSGYLYVCTSPSGALYFRKSISPLHDNEVARVQSVTAKILEHYPALQATSWAHWHSFLQTLS